MKVINIIYINPKFLLKYQQFKFLKFKQLNEMRSDPKMRSVMFYKALLIFSTLVNVVILNQGIMVWSDKKINRVWISQELRRVNIITYTNK